MIILNINERKWYIYKEGFAEKVINDMFEKYFSELYQKNAVKWRINEIWEQISIKIPKRSVFVEKDSILYSVNSDLKFEIAPEDFFEIDEVSHPILIECFNKCYSEFKNLIKNYREWSTENENECRKTETIANIFLQTSTRYIPRVKNFSKTIESAKDEFYSRLEVSLKEKMCNDVADKIAKVYESALLQSSPIMLITKTDCNIRKIYAITEDLEVEEVTYSLIEREVEEIIHEVVPEDTDFLVNMVYNYMMLPLGNVEPCIRINKVQKEGINATIFLEDKDIPVVCDLELKEFYAFLKIKHDGGFPSSRKIRYHNNNVCVEALSPNYGLRKIQEVNQTMFDNMTCYVENAGETYIYYYYSYGYQDYETDSCHNLLYKLKNCKAQEVYKEKKINKKSSDFEKIKESIEKEGAKAEKQGCYAFWRIFFKESE